MSEIDEYEYRMSEEILPPDQSRVLEQAKFIYSPLGKAFEKQIKTKEGQGKKQVEALKVSNPAEQKSKSIEGFFQKIQKTVKFKIN